MAAPQAHAEAATQARPGRRGLNLMWISYAVLSGAALYIAATAAEVPTVIHDRTPESQAHAGHAHAGVEQSADSHSDADAGRAHD